MQCLIPVLCNCLNSITGLIVLSVCLSANQIPICIINFWFNVFTSLSQNHGEKLVRRRKSLFGFYSRRLEVASLLRGAPLEISDQLSQDAHPPRHLPAELYLMEWTSTLFQLTLYRIILCVKCCPHQHPSQSGHPGSGIALCDMSTRPCN